MRDGPDHGASVGAWLARSTRKGTSPEQLVTVFAAALEALWQRARLPLGDITLTAIVDRVLHNAAERHPVLASLKFDERGVRFEELRAKAGSVKSAELAEAIRFVLVEFLTVLGNLTAQILTADLHAELGKVAVRRAQRDDQKK